MDHNLEATMVGGAVVVVVVVVVAGLGAVVYALVETLASRSGSVSEEDII